VRVSKIRIETPHSYFEEINNRLSWQDILSKCGIRVKKQQNNSVLIILCPFHDEKTPSLQLNECRCVFGCLGCGKSGDKFDFIVRFFNRPVDKDKMRAYCWFKKNFNIPLPWEKSKGQYIYR